MKAHYRTRLLQEGRITAGGAPLVVLLGASLLALAVSCGDGAPRRSGLLITLDTTNREALTCYGGLAGLTPNLDRLAAEGVRFDAARTVAPITAPAHASILTGLVPLRHSVRMNATMVLPAQAVTLAERARAAGMQTGAVVAAVVLDDEFGLSQGFESYDQPAAGIEGEGYRVGTEVTDAALAWIRGRDPDRPFFLWVHYFDAHAPYRPPARFLERAHGDRYLGEVAYVDQEVGRLRAALEEERLLSSTLVVVVADHGEGLGRHGERTHGTQAYDSTLAVPLIVRDPEGVGAGTRVPTPVSVVDVYPTFLEAFGIGTDPGGVDGVSLFRRTPDPRRGVYFETFFGAIAFGTSQVAGWADADGKYIHSSRPEFYDTAADPEEEHDLCATLADRLDVYRAAIAAVAARPRLDPGGERSPTDALRSQIEKLGYAGADTEAFALPEPLAPSDRPSPHDRIGAHDDFVRARSLADRGRAAEAIELLSSVVEREPYNHTALDLYGQCLMSVGRYASAVEAFERAVAQRGGVWVAPYLNIAVCQEHLRHPAEAIEAYEHAFVLGTGPDEALERLIALLEEAGRDEDAARYRALRPGASLPDAER